MPAGVDLASGMPSGTEALFRAALGPPAARIYLPFFARFEERGRSGLVWSPRAALGNLAWLVYWRLWDAVLVQSILTVAGAGALGCQQISARVPAGRNILDGGGGLRQ